MSDISYGELYAGIHLSQDPSREERRVQRLLAVNRIEIRLPGTLDIAKRAGQLYSSYLRKRGEGCQKDTARFLDRRPCRSLRIPACNLESGGLQELSLDRGPDPWRGYQRERAPEKSPKKATYLSSSRLSAKNMNAKILTLRVPRKSPGKCLRVRVYDRIGMTLGRRRTLLLMGPCIDPASNGASRKTRYVGQSRDAELPVILQFSDC